MQMHASTAGRFSVNGYLLWISTKVCDVLLYPYQCGDLIFQTVIPSRVRRPCGKETCEKNRGYKRISNLRFPVQKFPLPPENLRNFVGESEEVTIG